MVLVFGEWIPALTRRVVSLIDVLHQIRGEVGFTEFVPEPSFDVIRSCRRVGSWRSPAGARALRPHFVGSRIVWGEWGATSALTWTFILA